MKRGFTLIELLAVIVILAIIALIAMPEIINIINDSRDSSNERSIEMYKKAVENAITRDQVLNSGKRYEGVYTTTDGRTLIKDDIVLIIEYDGPNVKCDTYEVYENGKINISGCTISNEKNIYSDDTQQTNNIQTRLLTDESTAGNIGAKYAVKVNENQELNFYVLSTSDDGMVNLIMEKNICEDGTTNYTSTNNYCKYAWNSGNLYSNHGPTLSMMKLYNATKNWTNIDAIVIDHSDKNYDGNNIGYKNIKTNNGETIITGNPESKKTTIGTSTKPLKARFAKENEIALYCDTTPGSCPFWIVENLTFNNDSAYKYFENNNNKSFQKQIYGYWLLDSSPQNTQNASNVHYDGHLHYTNSTAQGYGIRPVITVPNNILN